ncbi:MAG: hypothetical protein WC956_00235 [bacterium]
MAKKKGVEKVARLDTPVEDLDEKETLMHYNAVLIEELNSKIQLILECVKASSDELGGRISSLESRIINLETRVTNLENRISTLELAFRNLKDDMLDMERRICSKINRVAERCENYECRLVALESGH